MNADSGVGTLFPELADDEWRGGRAGQQVPFWNDRFRAAPSPSGTVARSCPIAVRNLVEDHDAIKDLPGLDSSVHDIGQKVADVNAHRSGTACHGDVGAVAEVVEKGVA
jgi:hypothetical protein